jgi:hypothetical protein
MDTLAKAHLKLAFLVMGVVLVGTAVAQTAAPAAVALTPVEMKWQSQGGLAAAGMEQLNLVGDPAKPGPYTLRLKFPKGFRIAPHTHPHYIEIEEEVVLQVSGTGPSGRKFVDRPEGPK